MRVITRNFLAALKSQLEEESVSYKDFIKKETYLNGRRFSFKGHEYQEYILDVIQDNPGCIFSVSKCSQIGLSEIANRFILARMAIRAGTSALVSFPSITFSQEVFKTRLSSVIRTSPRLNGLINKTNDSASIKEFNNSSIAYALGGSKQSEKSLLNRPIDTILVDEYDRQDTKVIGSYRSRMTHTPARERVIINISTPTVDGIGIDAAIKECGIVHTPWIKCPHCGAEFIGDYYEHIVVPGFNESLHMLSKEAASSLDLSQAYLKCAECGEKISEEEKLTVWKVETVEGAQAKRIGIVLDPFVALSFQPIGDLVEASLDYTSHTEWLNQGLGKVAPKSDSTLDLGAIKFIHEPVTKGTKIFGLDFGKQCHWMSGVLKPDTTLHVYDSQVLGLADVEEFLKEQFGQHAFAVGVCDSQPYTDLVYRLVKKYPRLFSAIYIAPNPPRPELYTLKLRDDHGEVVRQVNINKSLAMDSFANSLSELVTFESSTYDSTIQKHFLDMRRVRDYRFDQDIYKWQKSQKGRDHFWHSANYLYIASKLCMGGYSSSFCTPVVMKTMNPDRVRRNKV